MLCKRRLSQTLYFAISRNMLNHYLNFFHLPLFFVLLMDSVSFDVLPLTNLGDKFVYSLKQTSYLKVIWCTSKITKKYVDMQTIQSFHFLGPTHISHS